MTLVRDFPVPAHLDARARTWLLARGDLPAGQPHPADGGPAALAATVVLVRGCAAPLERGGSQVWTMRRATTMAFAAGVHAFPGGRVDPADHEPVPWHGPPPSWFAAQLGVDAGQATALVQAGIRELFEESGVLLARPADPACRADSATDADRIAVLNRTTTLADLLRRTDRVLATDRLHPWARWITPLFEPRRYDTVFWRVEAEEDDHPRHVGGEADTAGWTRPQELLVAHDAGDVILLPPTRLALERLATGASDDAALVPVTPVAAWADAVGGPVVVRADLGDPR